MKIVELTRSGVVGTVMVFVIVAVCVRLGFWQLDRRTTRLALNAVIAERLEAEPVTLDRPPVDTTGLTYRRVIAHGQLDADRSVVLAGRSYQGSPGAHLLVPLRMGGGGLLVNRGWLPAPDAASVDRESVRIHGKARVEGVLMPYPEVEMEPPSVFTDTWYRLAGDAIRAQYPYPLASVYLRATTRPQGVAGSDTAVGVPVLLGLPEVESGPHLSYAIQWFSFGGIFLIGWLVLLIRATGEGPARSPGPRGAGRPAS